MISCGLWGANPWIKSDHLGFPGMVEIHQEEEQGNYKDITETHSKGHKKKKRNQKQKSIMKKILWHE